MHSVIRFGLTLLLVLACTKPATAPTNTFNMEGSPDETFKKVVDVLVSQGFTIENVDPAQRRVKSSFKETDLTELERLGQLDGPIDRYLRGRLSYEVEVLDNSGSSTLKVSPRIEGSFQGKQSSSGSETTQWRAATSSGAAEQQLSDWVGAR